MIDRGEVPVLYLAEHAGEADTPHYPGQAMSKHGSSRSAATTSADHSEFNDSRTLQRIPRKLSIRSTSAKVAIGIAIVVTLIGVYGLLSWSGALAVITDRPTLERYVTQLGVLGPLAVIGLLTTAIVVNPIPSAPIALVAGAAYGHVWGTVYVVIGAEIGALTAFAIARLVGYDMLNRWLGKRLSLGPLASQNALMAIVFASRLLPFISFDLVSYAAGLTPLTTWRFAIATLAGVVPASFLLAHFGGEMASGDSRRITLAILALGTVTGLPLAGKVLLDKYRRRRADRRAKS